MNRFHLAVILGMMISTFEVDGFSSRFRRKTATSSDITGTSCTSTRHSYAWNKCKNSYNNKQLSSSSSSHEIDSSRISKYKNNPSQLSSRRRFFEKLHVGAFTTLQVVELLHHPTEARAAIDDSSSSTHISTTTTTTITPKKPFAPLSALLPAARVKSTIDDALKITNDLIDIDSQITIRKNDKTSISTMSGSSKEILLVDELSKKKSEQIIQLQELILEREKRGFMQPLITPTAFFNSSRNVFGTTNMISSTSTSTGTTTKMPTSNSKLYDETYKEKLKNIPVTDIPLAILTQAGDKRQYNILQRRQRTLEKDSPIRQALNFYTRQLQFNTESYVLNVNSEERKSMIRNDALPDIKSVIVSDLDLRDLVRNQILDAFDDVRAELQFQVRGGVGGEYDGDKELKDSFDAKELQVLLMRAQNECNRWFDFIDKNDVEEAMNAIAKES